MDDVGLADGHLSVGVGRHGYEDVQSVIGADGLGLVVSVVPSGEEGGGEWRGGGGYGQGGE